MARMYGRINRGFDCPCCDWSKGKRAEKASEERQWRREAEEELAEHPDQYWLFLSPTT